MLTDDILWTLCSAGAIFIFGMCAVVALWGLVSIPLALLVGRVVNASHHALREQAADWNEPPREQVEATYGPRAIWGPSDAEADAEWADILRAVDLTPEQVRERHRASQQADRMDRIRADIACNRFRRELDDFDGGAAS